MSDHSDTDSVRTFDIFVIGGGVNGCGIARDAAGRGLSVALAEMNDLGSATSSASTKLFHGGLRYLEYFEIHLVREALREREVLLRAMPHISWPMRFVLPCSPDMRFPTNTPASRILGLVMPWLRGRRPLWIIRLGLFIYDRLGSRMILPGTEGIDLGTSPEGEPLKDRFRRAFEFSDCWVQDSRLVVLNARDAAERGARIMTRTRVTGAKRQSDHWTISARNADGRKKTFRARCLVNAGGPWVEDISHRVLGTSGSSRIRLVGGSHIVTKRLYDHDKCYFLQGSDGRIIFTIPFEGAFTLIGTTDREHTGSLDSAECSEEEADYLRDFASGYFKRPIAREDVVWSFSGVRPLYDDGATSLTAATRDYVLSLDTDAAPLLNVFGGKITTYRKLAEASLAKLSPIFDSAAGNWTKTAPLPGGDFPVGGARDLAASLAARYPFLSDSWAERMVRTYGTDTYEMFADAASEADLGVNFGKTVTERELEWAISREWVRSAEDFLWRRTKLGLVVSKSEANMIERHIAAVLENEETLPCITQREWQAAREWIP